MPVPEMHNDIVMGLQLSPKRLPSERGSKIYYSIILGRKFSPKKPVLSCKLVREKETAAYRNEILINIQ